eukprot:4715498-Prymnesium_polylepis.1
MKQRDIKSRSTRVASANDPTGSSPSRGTLQASQGAAMRSCPRIACRAGKHEGAIRRSAAGWRQPAAEGWLQDVPPPTSKAALRKKDQADAGHAQWIGQRC